MLTKKMNVNNVVMREVDMKKIGVNKVELIVDKKYVVEKFPLNITKEESIGRAKALHPTGRFTRYWIGKEEEELKIKSIPESQSAFVQQTLKKKIKFDDPVEDEVFSEYESI